jgi:hypothetical protein
MVMSTYTEPKITVLARPRCIIFYLTRPKQETSRKARARFWVLSSLAYSSILKIKVICPSETSGVFSQLQDVTIRNTVLFTATAARAQM